MASTKDFHLDTGHLEYLFNHIFLPPNVPQADDYRDDYEQVLLRVVSDALKRFTDHVTSDTSSIIRKVTDMVDCLRSLLGSEGITNGERLQEALADIGTKGGVLLLHIRAQNCGIMMSRVENSINIEAFELSPINTSVITALGRLRRTFPGPALSINIDKFQNSDFQVSVAKTLAKMSHQRAPNTKPKVRKQKKMHDEERDTTHPKIVTELFFNFLRPQCTQIKPFSIVKNTREEVMWDDCKLPWHRSSLWLLVRVGMQLVFARSSEQADIPNEMYKLFMVFLLTTILDLSCQAGSSCEMVYAMQAKIGRRLLKLEKLGNPMKLDYIELVMQQTSTYLQSKWVTIISESEPRIRLNLGELHPTLDTVHDLPEIDDFIQELSQRTTHQNGKPLFSPPSRLVKFHESRLPSIDGVVKDDYLVYNLKAFESWVESSLGTWVARHLNDETACGELGRLMCAYHKLAAPLYKGNPEATSEMLLIITEIWIACDKCAVSMDEIISQYDVGIPDQLFQCFILRSKPKMQRLSEVENYIRSRRDKARYGPSITFQGFGNSNCYSVKYFERSQEHQKLMRDIEAQARQTRQEKIKELHEKQSEYNELITESQRIPHDQEEVVVDYYRDIREYRCRISCRKCICLEQAERISINIHEWPLPTRELEAKSVIFELKVPQWYGYWRDSALYLLDDVFRMYYATERKPRAQHTVSSYSGLQRYFEKYSSMQRLCLLSEDKPHINTHRKGRFIVVATESDVCLENALHYHCFDSHRGVFIDEFEIEPDYIPSSCMYILPEKSSALQQYLQRPPAAPNGPAPNMVIASQCDCPDSMQLEEFKALSHLALGTRIQWQNILVQLSMRAVNFKKCETTLFILQTIYQAGPASASILREGHQIIDDDKFARMLLTKVGDMIQTIRENWEGYQALHALMSITARILSLTPNHALQKVCLEMLQSMRLVACSWINTLKQKVQESTVDQCRQELSGKAVLLALICVSSFDVDEDHLHSMLSNQHDLSVLIQNSIVIEEGRNCITTTLDPLASILHLNWQRLLFRASSIIIKHINDVTPLALDDAIRQSWSAYRPGTAWEKASQQEDDWLFALTARQSRGNALPVHYNILTGELLVDGDRLSSLPPKYEQHPNYRILFGSSSLEIMPSGVPGMRYSTKKEFAGHTVHFGLSSESNSECDLKIRAVQGDQTLELVPSRLFRDKFPSAFIDNFVHWYDVAKQQIEFRPLGDVWHSSPEAWILARNDSGDGWQLTRGESSLMNIKSRTVRNISRILAPLELAHRMHVILKTPTLPTPMIEIDIPRLDLCFQIEQGSQKIRSRQFRGFCIDEDQSLGSLVNFKNKLVLTHEQKKSKLVLLLEGSLLQIQKLGDHVIVQVNQEADTRRHAYHVDPWLGRLLDSGNLQSKLVLCLMHALTSFCLPDPLTKKTGTEQALSILNSASVRSFDALSEENFRILHEIARLSPQRQYYPQNEKVMQTVIWRTTELGFLAQDGAFFSAVKSLVNEKVQGKFLWPETCKQLPDFNFMATDLLTRDLIRSSTFRVSGFGAERHTKSHDREYHGRDRDQGSESGMRVFVTADLTYHERQEVYDALKENMTSDLWMFLSKSSPVYGLDRPFPTSEINYDAQLLVHPYGSIRQYWPDLHRILHIRSPASKFNVMLWLSTLAFGEQADMLVVQTLILFYTSQNLDHIQIPPRSTFYLSEGHQYENHTIKRFIELSCRSIHDSPEGNMVRHPHEPGNTFQVRKRTEFEDRQSRAVNFLTDKLREMWPIRTPLIAKAECPKSVPDYIIIEKAMVPIRQQFERWYDNREFYQYLNEIAYELARCPRRSFATPWIPRSDSSGLQQRNRCYVTMADIFSLPAPEIPSVTGKIPNPVSSVQESSHPSTDLLKQLIENLEERAQSRYEKSYVAYLRNSLDMLQKYSTEGILYLNDPHLFQNLQENLAHHRKHILNCYDRILSVMKQDGIVVDDTTSRNKWWQIVMNASHGPRLCPSLILEQLNRQQWSSLPATWKQAIVAYGLAFSGMQHAERLLECRDNQRELIKEIQNRGHENWDPHQYPDSLLLEVESSIRIRKVQEEIANEMRHRPAGGNAVMQLNMGEGKSSVIVPIVAAALADGSRLVRIIVAKPQSKQMFEMLLLKLSGMLGRRIYRLPFSRALKINSIEAEYILEMCQECIKTGGVLLVQPEQILSLKLMCLECIITGKVDVGQSLLKIQALFDQYARDIVDESDENFSVKFELIYTMGDQKPVQLSPERWTVVHDILNMVREYSPAMKNEYPLVEIGSCPDGGFPRTRIAHEAAQQELIFRIARTICKRGVSGFPIARQGKAVRDAIYTYITKWELDDQEIQAVEKDSAGFWGDTTRDILLLLRGLLAGRVLSFALGSKRWRVNYGLTTSRNPPTKLAVPYRAKDNPTARSEFSHPDVVIILTSLSYYYSGLEDDDLFDAFQHLLKGDQADVEYQIWVKDADRLPEAFQQLVGINLQDRFLCIEKLFPPFRFAKSVIDYFLSHIVFPKEMKEFPHKLSASGWDIGQLTSQSTTGFSGTNDSRQHLPIHVEQLDLPEQMHTNALVLNYLLQPENDVVEIPYTDGNETSNAQSLLNLVMQLSPTIQVILDVGAQVLELSNVEVAREWLEQSSGHTEQQAVVFFDDDDNLCVLDRKGQVELLQTSPFGKQLDVCYVFLDEAHTRGTDLKLPEHYRAAVTLGAGITKDRLVQACMRMRKLGHGQSVVFCVPDEIQYQIREQTGKNSLSKIDISDVLTWAIRGTWDDAKKSMPLWAAQGERFVRQKRLWSEMRTDDQIAVSSEQARKFLEEEAQSLEQRYRPGWKRDSSTTPEQLLDDEVYSEIVERCGEFDNVSHQFARMNEEQERELSPEIQQERQVQKPPKASPAQHSIHPDLEKFIFTGKLLAKSFAVRPAFQALAETSAVQHLDVAKFPRNLLVTRDFCTTIQPQNASSFISDAYQRSVQWILTSRNENTQSDTSSNVIDQMVIISPFEAQQLYELIKNSKYVTMHLYGPRSNLGIPALDSLDLYNVSKLGDCNLTIPPTLAIQLNLFAGQLYFGSFEEYVRVCEFLGVAWETREDVSVDADGFICGDNKTSTFRDSPIKFLKVLMSQIRRNGEGIDKTHMGKLCNGMILSPSDFSSSSGMSTETGQSLV